MSGKIIYIPFGLFIIAMLNCGFFFSTSPESIVKDSPLAANTKITIGEALEQYPYIKNGEWTTQKLSNGEEAVKFTAEYTLAGVLEERYSHKKDMITPDLLDYLNGISSELYIIGIFEVKDGKLTNFTIQPSDSKDKIYMPMSLPSNIFIEKLPIPERFFTNEAEKNFQYSFYKYIFSHSFKPGDFFYFLYRAGSLEFPVRATVSQFAFEDKSKTIVMDGEFYIIDFPIYFYGEGGTWGEKSVYYANNKILDRTYGDLSTHATGLEKLFPEVTNSKIIQKIKFSMGRMIRDRTTFYSNYKNPNSYQSYRLIFDVQSLNPFICRWRFEDSENKFRELLSPETIEIFKKLNTKTILQQLKEGVSPENLSLAPDNSPSPMNKGSESGDMESSKKQQQSPLPELQELEKQVDDLSAQKETSRVSFSPGLYIGEMSGSQIPIYFNMNGSGQFEDPLNNRFIWRQDGQKLIINAFGKDNSQSTFEGKIENAENFVMDDTKFNIVPATKPNKFQYLEADYFGFLYTYKRSPKSKDIYLHINTSNKETSSTCNVDAVCKLIDKVLHCKASNEGIPEEENGEGMGIQVNILPSYTIEVNSTYSDQLFCGNTCGYTGKYKYLK